MFVPLRLAHALNPSTIAIDATAYEGTVQPRTVGQMAEWAYDEMNGAWADRARSRSLETETVHAERSNLYDAFTGTAPQRSRWTPMSLDTATAGSVSVASGTVTTTAAQNGRFGIMSNDLGETRYTKTLVEARFVSATGMNALLNLYGGTGAGDFTKFVEFGVEAGVLKVFADGQAAWTGGAATLPATLRIEAGPLRGTTRDLGFYYNNTLVRTMTAYAGLGTGKLRAFVYGFSGAVSVDHVSVWHDDTYDTFGGSTLSPRWTPTLLEGTTSGTTSVGSDRVQISGGAASRYALLSNYIDNSATDWTTIDARLISATGTNALMNIYGGSGAGDFTKFMEFGVEGGIARVFAASGNWSGGAVTLPATLSVQMTPYYANGRGFRFYVHGSMVHETFERKDVPPGDVRLALYGYGTSVTQWDYVNVSTRHMWDQWAPHFGGGPSLSVEWTATTLAGGWGTANQGSGQATINGAANSRYGLVSQRLEESDIYAYTVEAKLDSVSGTNGMLDLYAGTGRGDFTKFIEFGVEGGLLKVHGDGIPSWTGPSCDHPGPAAHRGGCVEDRRPGHLLLLQRATGALPRVEHHHR